MSSSSYFLHYWLFLTVGWNGTSFYFSTIKLITVHWETTKSVPNRTIGRLVIRSMLAPQSPKAK